MRGNTQRLAGELRARMGDRSQSEFAATLGISQARLSEILSGSSKKVGLTKAAEAIICRYPELGHLFLPECITKDIGDDHGN